MARTLSLGAVKRRLSQEVHGESICRPSEICRSIKTVRGRLNYPSFPALTGSVRNTNGYCRKGFLIAGPSPGLASMTTLQEEAAKVCSSTAQHHQCYIDSTKHVVCGGVGFRREKYQSRHVGKYFFRISSFLRNCWAWGITVAALSLSFHSVAASSPISCDAAVPPSQSTNGGNHPSALPLQSSSNDKEWKRDGGKKGPTKGATAASKGPSPSIAHQSLLTSVRSYQGHRSYMEDAYVLSDDGLFAAVFDGHGGSSVSGYLRQNIVQKLQAKAPTDEQSNIKALKEALAELDEEVLAVEHWKFQGSTALAIIVSLEPQGGGRIITANVGDSRAVLSRRGHAIDLSHDHKPNTPKEVERIQAHGGDISWFGFHDAYGAPMEGTGVFRINGNLAVARSIGDLTERPYVTGEADVDSFPIDHEGDQFIIIATDGLWDVFSSEEAVQYVHTVMGGALGSLMERRTSGYKAMPRKDGHRASSSPRVTLNDYSNDRGLIRAALLKRKTLMARYLTDEAIRRGTLDNITVCVLWLSAR